MTFSIIIPAYNAQETIRPCLDSIVASNFPIRDYEIIVVDDHSRDQTADIVKPYPCRVIQLDQTSGAAHARNTGAQNAQGEILVFIDADVGIPADALKRIANAFIENKDVSAMTGCLSRHCVFTDFFSQYKNLYMHFIFSRCPAEIDFLYGSLMAIRRRDFIPFDETYPMTDDTELGQRYTQKGYAIRLDHSLEVEHMKRYSGWSFFKNDFFVPFWWARTFLRHRGFDKIWRQKRFSHARISQLLSIGMAYLIMVMLSVNWLLGAIFLSIIFLFLNLRFLIFLFHERGLGFGLRAIGITFLDQLVMGGGIITGLIVFCLGPFMKHDGIKR